VFIILQPGCYADFFSGTRNSITFPYSSRGIHFVTFFLKLLGTKNSMTFAIKHLVYTNTTAARKFPLLISGENPNSGLGEQSPCEGAFYGITLKERSI
jgi:hypothetical protein